MNEKQNKAVIEGLVDIWKVTDISPRDSLMKLLLSSLGIVAVYYTAVFDAFMVAIAMLVVFFSYLATLTFVQSRILIPKNFVKMVKNEKSEDEQKLHIRQIKSVVKSTKMGIVLPIITLTTGGIETWLWVKFGMVNVGALWLTVSIGLVLLYLSGQSKMNQYLLQVEG
ncbi:MAG: hypothetical protein KJO69_03360 [Gammaproteobacteria bacterium]|nr:hypothetical protein [Gammaproteobacteria bacterium]